MKLKNGELLEGDVLKKLRSLESNSVDLVIADPPYFQVMEDANWDNLWSSEENYIQWTEAWIGECRRVLKPKGLMYVFGQPGKREHVWIHLCSRACLLMQYHDMIIWDRVVGYNDRSDSFTPQYEMILALRQKGEENPYFNKDIVRTPYDEETIKRYMSDKRYKDKAAREAHLRKGKKATNIFRVPSLKGNSKEKAGHPTQKPVALIEKLVTSSSPDGGKVLDPFMGSGTTAVVCEDYGRTWIGIEEAADYNKITKSRLAAMPE
ncbi:MAG: site-specific DNA-methyltransferase [Verrucomicrobiota bacterium]